MFVEIYCKNVCGDPEGVVAISEILKSIHCYERVNLMLNPALVLDVGNEVVITGVVSTLS
jgi:hypothetical protein